MPGLLKDSLFGPDRFRAVGKQIAQISRGFDRGLFQRVSLAGLDELSLLQRVDRMTEALRRTLPDDYHQSLRLLRRLAPRIGESFMSIALPHFVAKYGREDFETSMDALKFFTRYGSSEFAVREFLRQDLTRALKVMETWSRDKDEHVRRLASEGCRPRLPWSFRLEALVADPNPVAPILENLKADPSLYVRKSVANHLNDIAKDHPEWVLRLLREWGAENPHTAWVAKRGLRTLIKNGNRAALAAIGAGQKPRVDVSRFSITPRQVVLGRKLRISFTVRSRAAKPQRLVVDYAIHYVKKRGHTAAKVFKLRELTLAPGASVEISRNQTLKDFTTRKHHPGRHNIDLLINGERAARGHFELARRGLLAGPDRD